jgi:hypothetical protein
MLVPAERRGQSDGGHVRLPRVQVIMKSPDDDVVVANEPELLLIHRIGAPRSRIPLRNSFLMEALSRFAISTARTLRRPSQSIPMAISTA